MKSYIEHNMWLQDGGDVPPAVSCTPVIPERILNHWDNLDGSVERGYSGGSLFFKDGEISYDPDRIHAYANFLRSIGINRVCLNNVNVSKRAAMLITEELLPDFARLSAIFGGYGIRTIISVDFESPVVIGGLSAADPLDERVAAWWADTVKLVYKYIPDLAGLLVKADSEFRGGPSALGRSQADGANMLARAVKPHGGKIYWRCFIYNCTQDWRDMTTDRPNAPYNEFMPLDGKFDDNVILQVKHGPFDFQVREPNSPLFGAIKHTAQALELQITQEYTGQQIDLFASAVQWEEIFSAPVSDTLIMRDLFGKDIQAIVAVANTGLDDNWTGHTLAQANLYSFGRMSCEPSLTASEVLNEWIGLTFGHDPALKKPILDMMLQSRHTYEKYTTPFGLCWMVSPNNHYGPSPEGYEYAKWGTYHRASCKAIGVDRTENGTGHTSQYHPYLAKLYSDPHTCPEDLLLFFHRLPYTHLLKNGKNLLQNLYNSHFEGAAEVEAFIKTWQNLKNLLPESAYNSVLKRLRLQLKNAEEWRDVINTYFFRKSGIADEAGRKIFP